MSVEIPQFHTAIESDELIVSTDHQKLSFDVVFDMLSEVSVRRYNISTPKDQNMYLRELEDRPEARNVETKLELTEAKQRMEGLIAEFGRFALNLAVNSDHQYDVLVDHSVRRVAFHNSISE